MKKWKTLIITNLNDSEITIQKGEGLTKIKWNTNIEAEYAWLLMDDEYDMKKIDGGYEVTIKSEMYQEKHDTIMFITYKDNVITYYNLINN